MAKHVVKLYTITSKRKKVLKELQMQMQAYFHQLEESEHNLEIAAGLREAVSFEQALKDQRLEAVAMEASNDFAVLFFDEVTGSFFGEKKVQVVLKGTPARLRRAEVWINNQNCSLSRPRILKGAVLSFEVRISGFCSDRQEEQWSIIKRTISTSCPKTKIDAHKALSSVIGVISGPVEEVLIAQEILRDSTLLREEKSLSITFT